MEEIIKELKNIKGELLNLRNDVLYIQHTLTKFEKKLNTLAEPKQTDKTLENVYGPNTKIEKF